MKIPGMTTSPKPSIVKPRASEKVKDFGQSNLIGMSSEVATLTIYDVLHMYSQLTETTLTTSVPNTHQMS
jgi:hypothetical protein